MATASSTRVRDPLRLSPVLVPKPWGGRRLERFGRVLPPGRHIGESWEVADLDPSSTSVPDPVSRVAAGPFTGYALGDLVALDAEGLLGTAAPVRGRFPLLVKLLDAREPLSVQVHPTVEYAAEDSGVAVKTESWVVVAAEPGAELFLGAASGVSLEALMGAIGTPGIVGMLQRLPAREGEVHHVAPGTVHALGAGVLVAEVQTPSDTTFRMYDWAEEHGRAPRPIHHAQAARVLELAGDPRRPEARVLSAVDDVVVETPEYRIRRHRLDAGEEGVVEDGVVRVLIVTGGSVAGEGFDEPLGQGGVVVLPAAWEGALVAEVESTCLEVVPARPFPGAR